MTETPESLRPGFLLSWVNKLDPIRKTIVPINARAAMGLAERTTGLADWGDDDGVFSRLEDAIAGLNEVDLSTAGRFGANYVLHWHLSNKLRIVDALKRHPEIEDVKVERPLVITGFFRTGTTYLHAILAADPKNRVGRAWELMYPVGRPTRALDDDPWRRRRATYTLALNHSWMPDQEVAHHVVPDSFEECLFLLQNELASVTIFAAFGTFSYAWRTLDWNMVPPYESHRRQLQAMTDADAHANGEARWSLKCPWHLWHLDALLTVYPNARIIHTHRNVATALGSQASLTARMASKTQRSLDLKEVGNFWLDYSRAGIDRGMRVRESLPSTQVYDVRLGDLLERPLEVLQGLYSHFELPFDDELAQRFLSRIAEQPTAQLGEHDYDIADFGLEEGRVREVFSDYHERFGV
ncbi:MAG: sulfotransferase [Myxococcota bacterium]